MPAVKTGFTPPPMPGMPAPMQPMGGMPPAPGMPFAPPSNPFAPMPPMPLAGGPPPQMPQGQPMPQVQGQQMQGATAGRRRRFGDALEGMLGRNQGLGAAMPQPQRAMPPQMMPQQRMVAPGTPMMRTPPMPSMMPRPMEMGGEVDIFGYADGGPVVQYYEDAGEVAPFLNEFDTDSGTYSYGNKTGLNVDEYKALQAETSNLTGGGNATGFSPATDQYYFQGSPMSASEYSAAVKSYRDENPELAALVDSVNRFDPDTSTYTIASGGDPSTSVQYSYGTTYDDPTTDVVEELPADVAYSKRVQANRAALGLPANTTSAWELYKRGDHYSQLRSADSVDDLVDDVVVSQPVSKITGSEAGAGSSVGAGGNFGTGSYTADPVDPSEVNAIDYSQFTGDVGSTTGGYDVVDPETGIVTPGTREQAALYGPKVNIPTSVSQYMTDPVTGGLTTSYGPEMVATSPIGAIKLPARPVSIDIFDFLSTPTYGTMYSGIDAGDVDLYNYDGVNNMRMGGEVSGPFGGSSVPRSTMIADQPHMLAYINQDEEALLRSFGGSGIAGPGGIPSYPPGTTGYGSGEGTGYGSSISATRDRLKAMAKSDDDDDYTPTSAELASQLEAKGLTNITPGPLSVEDQVAQYDGMDPDALDAATTAANNAAADVVMESAINLGVLDDTILGPGEGGLPAPVNTIFGDDYTPTGADLSAELEAKGLDDKRIDTSLIDYTTTGSGGDFTTAAQADTGVSGAEFVAGPTIADLTDGDDSGVNIFQPTLASEETLPAPVVNAPVIYTDRRGNQYASQAAADAADRAFAAQLLSYGAGKEGFDSFADQVSKPYIPREESDRAASRIYTDNFRPELAQYRGPDILGGIYSDIEAIGGLPPLGDTRGGVSGIQPITSLNDPDITQSMRDEEYIMMENPDRYLLGSDNILDLNTPTSPLTDDDMGLPSGPVSDIDLGLGATGRQTYYGGTGPRDGRDMPQSPEQSVISQTIMGFEGRTENPYYDVNAYRAGYGSDTKTDPITGKVTKITEGMTVSKAEADADLNRRLTKEFIPSVVNTVGADTFYGMNPQQQAALTSIAYNYGKLPTRIESVVNNVDASTAEGQKAISDAIRSLGGDNDGINRNRRNSEADLFLGQGNLPETSVVEKPDTGVTPEQRKGNVETIKQQIGDQAEPTGIESIFYDVIGGLGFGLGKPLADKLRGSSRENRQAIIDQHVYALQNGATPKTDEDGNYIGFDISTMDTFADKVLGAEDIMAFMPPSSGTYKNPAYQADADGDNVSDYDRFQQVFGAQSTAADVDPTGMSTEQGFITSDGKEFFVDAGGDVVEVTDETVPFEVGGGQNVAVALGGTETTTGGDDGSEEIKNYITDEDGNKVCNDEGYVYNSETDMCELPAEEEKSDTVSSPIGLGIPSSRRFDDIMASITTPAPKIAPISANIRPMQAGGMAGLNRTADNFLKALAG